jgi:FkbM family methyltransferase
MVSLLSRVRRRVFPTAQEKTVERWYRDGGDARLTDYDIHPEDTVVEIGGFRGKWASEVFSRYACRVITAEPVPEYAAAMRRTFSRNPRIEIQEFGVGASTRPQPITISGEGSSVFRVGNQRLAIRILDVADWFPTLGIERSPLLIMNCEGGEYEIVPRLCQFGLAAKFTNIAIQFHQVGTDFDARRAACRAALASTHDEKFCYPFVWESWQLRAG